ncbi:hypothetical protein L1987_51268 [Smallanthus sonchifolius]|uniref:Uncharacterized protein n=1 Tax=Smallanthus sonchifolius TaxID=185202 RepID=A0ACB9EPT4_9ASTR|nr:hypothetical protein L1987_51268 [Smallanthus sonchifolius]
MSSKCYRDIPFENHLVILTQEVDHGIVTYLENVGFLTSNLLATHCLGIQLSAVPMCMLGFAPIKEMLDANVIAGGGAVEAALYIYFQTDASKSKHTTSKNS